MWKTVLNFLFARLYLLGGVFVVSVVTLFTGYFIPSIIGYLVGMYLTTKDAYGPLS